MSDIVLIEEIIRPAHQGMSKPYYCRGEDGNYYFVKGINTTRESQAWEWICGHLAQAFGLPLASFSLVEVVPELLEETQDAYKDIGVGLAFGSRQVDGVMWKELAIAKDVDESLQKDLLVFDWWIQNMDRTRFNTNLLWKADSKALTVIDHNCAFDEDFCASAFLEGHLFKEQENAVFGDLAARAEYSSRLLEALPAFDTACASIPNEWQWHDQERTVPANYDIARARNIVTRCNLEEFWRKP
jgi:hypothetical protein